MDIIARRTRLEERLEAQRELQGRAILAGETFDAATITELESELAGLAAAEGQYVRQQREEIERAEAARLAELRRRLAEANDRRQAAWTRAQAAAETLGAELKSVVDMSKDVALLARALGQYAAIYELDGPSVQDRIGHRLRHALAPVMGINSKLGPVEFKTPQTRYAGDWREGEERIVSTAIAQALKGSPSK